MAGWTNVRDEALPRIQKLSRLVNQPDYVGLGVVTWLWRESQDIESTEGSKEDIFDWAHLSPLSPEQETLWLDALIRARIISKTETGYKIHGNDAELSRKQNAIAKARKAGNARWGKTKSEPASCLEHAPSMLEASSVLANTKQSNTKQSKEENNNAQTAPVRARVIPLLNFEELYRKYPRKVGKKQGIARCRVQIRTVERYEELSRAIEAYDTYCKKQRLEARFIKHFSTFMNSWEDWLDPKTGDDGGGGPAGGETLQMYDANFGSVSVPREQYQRWMRDFKNGRGPMPPPLVENKQWQIASMCDIA